MEITTQGPSPQEWAQIRPVFTRLYYDDAKTLTAVRASLATQYGFRASIRMYKTRIRLWGLDKKRKASEMQALVSLAMARQRAGKRSRFRIRGRVVSLAEAQKYFQRKGITDWDEISGQCSRDSAPPDLACSTAGNSPEPASNDPSQEGSQDLHGGRGLHARTSQSRGLVPASTALWSCASLSGEFAQVERLLLAAREYFSPSSMEFMQTIVRGDLEYSPELQGFERHAHKAAFCADFADWEKATREYDQALAFVPEIIRGKQSLNFLVCLFAMIVCCENARRCAFIPAILQFVSQVATIVLPPRHPFCQLIQVISNSIPRVSDMIELSLKNALDMLTSENLGLDPRTQIIAYGLYETLSSKGKFLQAQELIHQSWMKEELLLGKWNIWTITSMIAMGKCSMELGDFAEAGNIVNDIIKRMQLVTDDGDRYRLRAYVSVYLKSCKHLRNKQRLHHQLINIFHGALDDNALSVLPSLMQHEV